jgi:hypothetical protein
VPDAEVPMFSWFDKPREVVAEDEISASGTAGRRPVSLKSEPRESVTE